MPSRAQKGQARPSEWRGWPDQTREHYIKLFSLQERLRARLKLAQELAVHNFQVKYPTNPRKTNPIPIAGKRQEDYLRKYQDEQLPYIRYYLSRMQGEIEQIKKAYKGGRPPKWYEVIVGSTIKEIDGVKTQELVGVETLTVNIWEAMDDIQVHLLLTLKGDSRAIKQSNEVIIDETRKVIKTALRIRKELIFLLPEQTTIGLDEFGIYDIIIDLAPKPEPEEQPYLDLTQILWQRSQQKKRLG